MSGNPHIDIAPAAPGSAVEATGGGFDPLGFLTSLGNTFTQGLQTVQQGFQTWHNFDANLATVEAQATVAKTQAKQSAASAPSGIALNMNTVLLVGGVAAVAYFALRR